MDNFIYDQNSIYLNNDDNMKIAEVTYEYTSDSEVDINRTFVDPSLRGQGIAGKLMSALAEKLKNDNLKARPSCSYAKKWFEKHPEYSYLLTEK